MPAVYGSAPGKIILFGEHAVVYGQPAIAVPVNQVTTRTHILADPAAPAGLVIIDAPNIHLHARLSDLPADNPLKSIANLVMASLNLDHIPAAHIKITSSLPLAGGMGSSASVTVSFARALSAFLGHPLPDFEINCIAFEIEKFHHGTPSGIDNSVITYARPLYFVKGKPIEWIQNACSFFIVIGDTGIPSATADVVNAVRNLWQQQTEKFDQLFYEIGHCSLIARAALEKGDLAAVGRQMQQNHLLLQQIDVSCPRLDLLVKSALDSGALGAKLSGGGRGGNMIALADSETGAHHIADCLQSSGAARTIITSIPVNR